MATQPPDSVQENDNTYLIDAESATEMVRLANQDRLITEAMGGVFPERPGLVGITRILDIACGPGEWTLQVARAYSQQHVQVTGVDISRTMVDYARARVRSMELDNATFEVMDATKPLDFPDGSFDLVNARFIAAFLSTGAWPPFLQECVRLVRPGGIVRLTEPEWNTSNKPNLEQLNRLILLAMSRAGKTFTPNGSKLGITDMLPRFLGQAHLVDVQYLDHILVFDVGTPAYEPFTENIRVGYMLVKPFLLKMGVMTEQEFERTLQDTQIEMLAGDFQGSMPIRTAWGIKPAV
jgi:ubiquinone/menaquinone biosynthesis C-methylase UbiE